MSRKKKSIYDKLDGLKAPIDRQAIWEGIKDHESFPTPQAKRGSSFWSFIGIGLLMFIGGLFLFSNFHLNSKTPTASKLASSSEPNKQVAIKTPKPSKTTIGESDLVFKHKAAKHSDNNSLATAKKHTVAIAQQYAPSTKTTNKKLESTQATMAKSREKGANNSLEPKLSSRATNTVVEPTATSSSIQTTAIAISNTPITHKNEQLLSSYDQVTDKNTKKTNSQTHTNNTDQLAFSNKHEYSKHAVETLDLIAPKLSYNRELPAALATQKDQAIKLFKQRVWRINIDQGVGYARHNVTAVNNAGQEHPSFQEQYTKSLASYLLNVRVYRLIKEDWEVGLGLSYANNRRRFLYTHIDTVYYQQSTYQYSRSINETTYTYYHSHQMMDVEAVLFRHFHWKKIRAYAGLGLAFNAAYQLKANGIDVDADNDLELINLNEWGSYKNSLGMQYLCELGVSKPLSSRLSLNAAVLFKSTQKLNQIQTHKLQQSYLKLGFTYSL